MKTLISMADFVLKNKISFSVSGAVTLFEYANKIHNYAVFLKQNLILGMFVPCDEEGTFLTEPKINDYRDNNGGNLELFKFNLDTYKKAKEKVLFKGFQIKEGGLTGVVLNENLSFSIYIPSLINCPIEILVNKNVELTESALKSF